MALFSTCTLRLIRANVQSINNSILEAQNHRMHRADASKLIHQL